MLNSHKTCWESTNVSVQSFSISAFTTDVFSYDFFFIYSGEPGQDRIQLQVQCKFLILVTRHFLKHI